MVEITTVTNYNDWNAKKTNLQQQECVNGELFAGKGGSNNKEIRAAAKAAKVCLWQIAKEFGMNDGNFSRKMREEYTDDEKARALEIIAKQTDTE